MQVLLARWYESFFGRKASSHLCVSKAMQIFLEAQWGITATVFYDKAPEWFHKASVAEMHGLFTRIAADLNAPMHIQDLAYDIKSPYSQIQFDQVQSRLWPSNGNTAQTPDHSLFTHLVDTTPQLRSDRPALIVSSTSWTMDEDFGIMLHAAHWYDQVSTHRLLLSRPLCIYSC